MNILVLSFGIMLLGVSMANVEDVKRLLSHAKLLITSWPIRDSIIAMVLTLVVSAWIIEVMG